MSGLRAQGGCWVPECGPGLERRGDGEEAGQEQAVAAPAASLSGTRGAVSPTRRCEPPVLPLGPRPEAGPGRVQDDRG